MSRCLNKTAIPISHTTKKFSLNSNVNEKDILKGFNVENVVTGYVGYFDPKFVKNELKDWDDVDIVEEEKSFTIDRINRNEYWKRTINRAVSTTNTTVAQSTLLWNLDRIDQTTNKLNKIYRYPSSAGKGVNIYIIDTGINVAHKEFEGRAKHGATFCDECSNIDDNGHGTHVAAIVAGRTYGVSKLSYVIAVKVLDRYGSGTTGGVIAGMTYVLNEHKKNKNKNTIVNMSLGGPGNSEAINIVMKKLFAAGIHVVVAAGNDYHSDSCYFTPASSPYAIAVGAINEHDELTDFTNTGKCISIFAPGENIKSAWISSATSTKILDGTSQATPHVSGTIALMISLKGNKSPSQIKKDLINLSTKNILKDTNTLSPNKLISGSPNNLLRVP